MSTDFELAKRMLYTDMRIAAPLHYLALLEKLTPAQRYFLLQESETISLSPNPEKESKQRLYKGRQRKPGGGRKQLGTRPEYIAALDRVMVMQSPVSSMAYSVQSARGISDALKQMGLSCSPSSVPKLVGAAGLRIHPNIKPSLRVKPVKPVDQFEFIGRRLGHILNHDTGGALYVTADLLPKTPCNCPADRLESWRGQALVAHIRNFLQDREEDFSTRKIGELMLIVEGGGLLGMRNRNFSRMLQLFADQTGITVYLSPLPPGLSRISTDLLAEGELSLTREQWKLGTVRLRIGSIQATFPPSNPQDGNFRPTSWNRIIRPIFLTDPNNDTQAAPSGHDIQDAAAGD